MQHTQNAKSRLSLLPFTRTHTRFIHASRLHIAILTALSRVAHLHNKLIVQRSLCPSATQSFDFANDSPRLSQRAASRHSVRWQLLSLSVCLCILLRSASCLSPSRWPPCNELHHGALCTAPLSLICICLAGATSSGVAGVHWLLHQSCVALAWTNWRAALLRAAAGNYNSMTCE